MATSYYRLDHAARGREEPSIASGDVAALMEFLEAVSACAELRLVGESFDATIRRLGFGDFSLRLRSATAMGGKPYDGIWTYSTHWEEHFEASQYFQISPVFRWARQVRRPFNWFELLAQPSLTKRERYIFAEAADFSIGMGLTVPIHLADGRSGTFTITTDTSLDPSADAIRVEHGKAHLLGLGLFETAAPLLHGQKLSLRDGETWRDPANDNLPSAAQAALLSVRHELTPFERECLAWRAAGCGTWMISERLKCSEAMVRRTLEIARLKLGATSQTHAVVKAIVARLVEP